MSVSPLKVWVAGEILTASDLNDEIDNILTNGEAVGFPRTTSADFDGQTLILDTDGNTTLRSSTNDEIDIAIGGTDTYNFTATAITILGKRVLTIDDLRTIGIEGIRAIVHSNRSRITELENDHVLAASSYGF